ncbi:hypothetical protein ACCO45_005420 [Purpureocillium lilacinum]|uniref:Uncharacterized protein n=1 Tax=Purpureocillium lilacinum TaxID=33203 RepID=A0ACC4DW95_PURLI
MDPAAMGDGDDADAAAMAQMMGFSAFGAQDRPQKKRRYNPSPTPRPSTSPRRSSSIITSNIVRATLEAPRPRRVRTRRLSGRRSAISLDDDEEADVAGDDAAVAAAAAVESTPIASLPRPAGLPERPAPGVGFVGMPPRRGHGELPEHTRDGGPSSGKAWYEDYYDPSSNENPWERLESSMGLSPRDMSSRAQHQGHRKCINGSRGANSYRSGDIEDSDAPYWPPALRRAGYRVSSMPLLGWTSRVGLRSRDPSNDLHATRQPSMPRHRRRRLTSHDPARPGDWDQGAHLCARYGHAGGIVHAGVAPWPAARALAES